MPLINLRHLYKGKRMSAPSIPAATRLYVVGDIHGRLDLLSDLEERIKLDLATAPAEVLTIFLGDYIDRGVSSAGVVERLCGGSFVTPIRSLRGNHEDLFLNFLHDARILESWRSFGGLETLSSYGVSVADPMRGAGYEHARGALVEALPDRHRQFLQSTSVSFSVGDYFFCHAGVRPGVVLAKQRSEDLLWIRDEFLQFEASHGKIVVHGHTPVQSPEVRSNRINIDTGAYASSILTALVIEGSELRFLSTRGTVNR
jgi:serine/threonine protein phosphatase 1